MDELEQQLRNSLRDPRHDVPYSVDPLPGVRSGMRQRQRRRTAASAVAALLLVIGVGAAIGSRGRGEGNDVAPPAVSDTSSPAPSATLSPTATAPAVVSSPPAASAAATAPASSATSPSSGSATNPAATGVSGFKAADLSFVSATKGWALGAVQCEGKPCPAILATADAGATWQRIGSPAAPLNQDGGMCADVCAGHLRFANSDVGYLFGGTQFMTVDGGATWKQTTGVHKVYALEPAGGDAIRVVATTDGCPPGCTFVVEKAPVGSSNWTRLTTPALGGVGARLLRHGNDVYVFADQHRSGGGGDAHTQILVSHDRGATWAPREDPCSPPSQDSPTESDSVDAATGVDGTLVLLCKRRAGNAASLRVSTDAGATFGNAIALPTGGFAVRVATTAAGNVVVADVRKSTAELIRSTDGGVTFTTVASAPQPDGNVDTFLAFTTDLVGTWTGPAHDAVWRTTDGGASWVKHPFG